MPCEKGLIAMNFPTLSRYIKDPKESILFYLFPQIEEHGNLPPLPPQLTDLLGDHLESAQDWLASLMENPTVPDQLLEQYPGKVPSTV